MPELERLTQRLSDGTAVMNCAACKASWFARHGKRMQDCTAMYCRNQLKDRLAYYEDILEHLLSTMPQAKPEPQEDKEGSAGYTKVFGYSDDIVEVQCSAYSESEIDAYESRVRVWFADGTVILVRYSDEGIWRIAVEEKGCAEQTLEVCQDKDSVDNYTDVFSILSNAVRHEVTGT